VLGPPGNPYIVGRIKQIRSPYVVEQREYFGEILSNYFYQLSHIIPC
jgi:hypothetical protein